MQQSIPQHLFSIPFPRNSPNRLLNKKLPAISVNEKTNTIECKESDGDPTLTRSQHPLPLDTSLSYFEVEILSMPIGEQSFNVGLTAKDNNMRQFAGKMINSVGFLKGEIYLNKKKVSSFESPPSKLRSGHRIGCGINSRSSTIFFTLNGVILQQGIPIPSGWTDFYPAVGLNNEGQMVRCWFGLKGDEEWEWKMDSYLQRIRKEATQEIYKGKGQATQMYSLIHEYLQFHGYTETLALMKSKKIQYPILPYPTKNTATVPSISLQEPPSQNILLPKMQAIDDSFDPPLKLRSRVMSQMAIDQQKMIAQLPRKNTLVNEIEVEERVGRKESLISNISLIDESEYMNSNGFDQVKQQHIIEEEQPQKQTTTEIFLFQIRPIILQHIAQQRIEQALQLLQAKLPKLFQLQELLEIHLKSHIFLRIAHKQSPKNAILYAQSQKGFAQFKNHLFPIFNPDKRELQWQSIKALLKILTLNPSKLQSRSQLQNNAYKMQFRCYAAHVNSLILKHLGYLQDSRLGIILQHTKRVQQKIKDFKVMTCGIQIHM